METALTIICGWLIVLAVSAAVMVVAWWESVPDPEEQDSTLE